MKCFHWFLKVKLVSPSLMPRLGKGGSLHSRQAIVHSLAHTESWAIDLSWVLIFPNFILASFFLVAGGESIGHIWVVRFYFIFSFILFWNMLMVSNT